MVFRNEPTTHVLPFRTVTFVMSKNQHCCQPLAWVVVLAGSLGLASCGTPDWPGLFRAPPPPRSLGTISDQYWTQQETNGEAWKNTIFQHEFKKNGVRLNWAGEDHVKQIAAQMQRNHEFPVLIERSTMTADPTAKYKFPVNPDPELDTKRREVIVQALVALGVPDASERVVIGPDFTAGLTSQQAENAYYRSMINTGGQFGGGFGGFGGGGFF